MSDILKKIKVVDFPVEQYYDIVTPKHQIVLHHTVSGRGINGDMTTWLKDTVRVATHIIIDWEGTPHQCFSSKFWGHHLGVKVEVFTKLKIPSKNLKLNQESISIEIDAYGGLKKDGEVWKTIYGNVVPTKNVQVYEKAYRGYFGFEKYTDAQIETVRELLLLWKEKYNIPLTYNENMWEVNTDALTGKPGVWTHTSYRSDKSDCHPQPELVEMLKGLEL